MQRWTSLPLRVSRDPSAPWRRADLAFEDLRDGPSFRVLLYLDNPDANEHSGRDIATGYAGEFPVFAHGDCWGDAGHCEVDPGPVSPFARRSMHPLTPIGISVEITEALQRVAPADLRLRLAGEDARSATPAAPIRVLRRLRLDPLLQRRTALAAGDQRVPDSGAMVIAAVVEEL